MHALWNIFLLSVCFLGEMSIPCKSSWLVLIILLLGYPCREVRVVKMKSFCLPYKGHSNRCGLEMTHNNSHSWFKWHYVIMSWVYVWVISVIKLHFFYIKIYIIFMQEKLDSP